MVRDYSKLAVDSMWPTSQAGGNMLAGNEKALTAPGSQPVDNLNARVNQMTEDPTVEQSNAKQLPPGTSGKPQASEQSVKIGKQQVAPPAWRSTIIDEVERDDSGAYAKADLIPRGTVPQSTDAGRMRG